MRRTGFWSRTSAIGRCITSIPSTFGAAAASATCSTRASPLERSRSIRHRYEAQLRAALKQGRTFTVNIELDDGRTIAVVNQPIKSGGWVATHEDITERKRAERSLESTRAFLDKIIENVPSPIIVKDAELRYVLLNRSAEQYLGLDRSVILGKTAAEVMPNGNRRNDQRARSETGRFGGAHLCRRTRHRHAGQRCPHRHRHAPADNGRRRKHAISHHRHPRSDRPQT